MILRDDINVSAWNFSSSLALQLNEGLLIFHGYFAAADSTMGARKKKNCDTPKEKKHFM